MRNQILTLGALCGLGLTLSCQPEIDPNEDPCALVRCAGGTHCEATDGRAECVPDASCDLDCEAGSHCELVDVQCVQAPCPPVEECVLDSVGGTACGDVTCGDGQVCCNASCGICTDPDMACIQVACEPPPDPGLTCASVLCMEGTHCIETTEGPVCAPNEENPCNLVDCQPNTICEVINGEAVCTPVNVGPGACAVTLCPVDTYCDDITGTAKCIPLPSCEGVSCEPGQHCELQEVQCVRAPCPPQPGCVADDECRNPCETVRCGKNTHCEAVDVVCVTTPCCPVAECKPNRR